MSRQDSTYQISPNVSSVPQLTCESITRVSLVGQEKDRESMLLVR